jgi:hypothetical protein
MTSVFSIIYVRMGLLVRASVMSVWAMVFISVARKLVRSACMRTVVGSMARLSLQPNKMTRAVEWETGSG